MSVETNITTPTLWEVSQMSRDFGLVGERDTHLVVLLSGINGGLVIMQSPSRSGKDMVVDAVEYCRPGNDIAKIPSSTSKTVLFERKDELNSALIHRYPDITSLEDHIESLLKDNGDGRPSSHQFTDVSGEQRTQVTKTIQPPNSMILFAASDNNKVDLNDYPEIRNRALIVSCDTSAALTDKVKERQADLEVGLYEEKLTEQRREEIREYIGQVPASLYTGDGVGEVWNVAHKGFYRENPLPDLFPESRMDFDRMNKFVKAVTLFHFNDRMEIGCDERDATVSLLSTPEDVWLGWKIFGEKMVLSALNLRDQDFEVLEKLRESAQALTVAEIQNELRREGQNLSDTIVRNSLNSMEDKSYVLKDASGQRVKYQPSPFATADTVSKNINISFQEIVDKTIEDAYAVLPDNMADEYVSQYCEGEGLITTHPTNGTEVNIIEESLTENITDAEEQEEQIIGETNPYSDDDDDGGSSGEIQGTIA